MNRAKASSLVAIWFALALGVEVFGACGYAVHAGWFGGLGVMTGPVSVFILEDSSDRTHLTSGQSDAIFSESPDGLRAWLQKHGEDDPFRFLGKNTKPEGEKWQTARDTALRGDKVPWIVILRSGRVLMSCALPELNADTMRLVKRFTGS